MSAAAQHITHLTPSGSWLQQTTTITSQQLQYMQHQALQAGTLNFVSIQNYDMTTYDKKIALENLLKTASLIKLTEEEDFYIDCNSNLFVAL